MLHYRPYGLLRFYTLAVDRIMGDVVGEDPGGNHGLIAQLTLERVMRQLTRAATALPTTTSSRVRPITPLRSAAIRVGLPSSSIPMWTWAFMPSTSG